MKTENVFIFPTSIFNHIFHQMSITFIVFERNNIKLCITFVQYLQFKGIQNFCKYEHFYKLLYRIFKKQDYKTLLTDKM